MTTLGGREVALPAALAQEVQRTQAAWQTAGNVMRLWARDASLWTGTDEQHWLGWLDIAQRMRVRVDELRRFGEEVRREGFGHALLLGMADRASAPR